MAELRFADPKNDVAFKKIFGNENKTGILISFLNAVLDLKDDKAIQEIIILNPYQLPKINLLKHTTLDVRAKDKRGVTFIVEMQVENVEGLLKRFLYYVAKAYSSQIQRGDDYPKLNQVIFIGILDFKAFGGKDYLTTHQILNTKTHEQEFKDIELNFIELPKFKKKSGELASVLEKWVYFIKHAEELEVVPENADFEELKEAYQEADQFGWTSEELELYENVGIKIQDERGAISLALKQGREEGIEQGQKQGIEQGQKQEKYDTARKMLADGLDLALVAKYTGLSADELVDL